MALAFVIPPSLLMLMFILLFIDSLVFKRSLKKVILKLRPIIFLCGLVLVIYIFVSDLYSGLSLALRLMLVFWLAQKIIEEVPVYRFIGNVAKWRIFSRLSLMLLIAATSFPIIYRESKYIYDAHVSRGIDFKKGNVFKRVKCLLYFLNIFFLVNFFIKG